MFQPQPTPYSTYGPYGIHIANAEVPEYAFQPTPLGQFGTGNAGAGAGTGSSGVGAGAGAGAGAGGPTAADIFASPIFHNHNPNPLIPTNANHLPYNSVPHNHHQSHSRRIKMEPQHPNDLAQQEAAAREYKPQLQVSDCCSIMHCFFSAPMFHVPCPMSHAMSMSMSHLHLPPSLFETA